ncbi:ABC-type lipoprotein release transport system permease subunit [Isoptericola sp. CG 20/1183]|uniref:ABC-type lipoprotein release transport system permease subunit n=1 Tax=Isoptericola halotolerans TaxID=300560 RepID=A0ABX5EDE9_9MICO|nr:MULTISPECIES: ABC transporter permease [Isoptericola]PRZ06438.1 ABC-type lipoprotein release transport system permease subunit [Isoptericola halotolerans]PRZ06756.1 ABC-type lipoprotein release transport system permease subunit [Isoptericola sp. CG 20/1183]
MFLTYLRRELRHRRKQTAVVAVGLAVAIALVMVVSSVSTGVRDAQTAVLESVYGVGTDVTVSQPGEAGGGRPGRFEFDAEAGEADDDGTRSLDQAQLSVERGTATFDAASLDTIEGVEHVTDAAAALTLTSTSFSGEMPDMEAMQEQMEAGGGPGQAGEQGGPGRAGGPDGAGGSAFEVDSFTVTGIDPSADAVGPLTTVEVAEGRGLEAGDDEVAVLDATYAETAEITVGDTLSVGDSDLEVVGTVTSTTGDGVATSSDVYVPLVLAQTLADLDGQVTDVYVSVDSADHVDAVADAVGAALPDASVSTQSDLADDVTGSLSTASSLVSTLGTWLSIIVLAAAFGLAILFTVSGVNRRTRELGTLKAIGWGKPRVVGQVAGESVVQGLLGGVVGVALGAVAVLAVNLAGITLSGSSGGLAVGGPGAGGQAPGGGQATGGGRGGGAPFGQAADTATSAVDVALSAPVTVWVVVAAVGLAVLGGLLAGVVGGWRAARLRPAEALRSLA